MVLVQQENNKRPFFSIVISCYNSRNSLGTLLDSIVEQDINDDLEIIISDDCSTEPYDDVLEPYTHILNIKRTSTEYNCCPSNTREAGAKVATGVWLTFSDHDDVYIKGGLKALKEKMMTLPEKYCIYTSFYELDEDYNVLKRMEAEDSGGWTHGKFYNLDNLWKDYDVHYKKDLKSHEDIYLTCSIKCIIDKIHARGEDALTFLDDIYTYGWIHHPTSQSHQRLENDYTFLEKHFIDYIQSTGEVYLDAYQKGIIEYDRVKTYLLDTLFIYYFYDQSFIFSNPNNPRPENKAFLMQFYKRIKETLGMSNKVIWQYAARKHAFVFEEANKKSLIATGGIIPSQTLWQWLNDLDSDESSNDIQISPFYVNK